MQDAIWLIELHDGRIDHVEVQFPATLSVLMTHAAVYVPEGVDTYGVWSYPMALRFGGLKSLEIMGYADDVVFRAGDYVSDGDVQGEDGSLLELRDAVDRTMPARRFELVLAGSGTRLTAVVESVLVELGGTGRRFETFTDDDDK